MVMTVEMAQIAVSVLVTSVVLWATIIMWFELEAQSPSKQIQPPKVK